MANNNYISVINELSATEGVFTTAQATRLGITRKALSQAVSSGRAERIIHGAYRLAGTPESFIDELSAVWKLTSPSSFTYERMKEIDWDGIAIGGATAACLLGIGDFYLSPYRIYAPKRINSRIESASFAKRQITFGEVFWVEGLPVTCAERTLVDLCLDYEDPSLIEDAFDDAIGKGADIEKAMAIADRVTSKRAARDALSVLYRLIFGEGKVDE
jgi:hypothetical protein